MPEPAAFVPRKRVEIDEGAIRANTAAIVEHVGPGVQVMAMVKANGYGHGLRVAAGAALAGGATWLGVASSVEALEVVDFGAPVLIVGRPDPGSHEALIEAGVDTAVYDAAGVADTATAAARVGRRARVHVKVDTGMGRLGVQPPNLGSLMAKLDRVAEHVTIVGVFTNFADADAPDLDFTEHQHAVFEDAVRTVRVHVPGVLAHCSNSCAIVRAPHMHHELVRPGLALYGYAPPVAAGLPLRPAMTMVAPVTQVKLVPPGTPVGYGRTWVAARESRIATVAAGYADGVLRAQSNAGQVLVAGRRCPIVGRVSMDQLTVDVTDLVGEVRPGDDAVLFGTQGDAFLGADEVAVAAGTIEREVLTAVPDRIPRLVAGSPA